MKPTSIQRRPLASSVIDVLTKRMYHTFWWGEGLILRKRGRKYTQPATFSKDQTLNPPKCVIHPLGQNVYNNKEDF